MLSLGTVTSTVRYLRSMSEFPNISFRIILCDNSTVRYVNDHTVTSYRRTEKKHILCHKTQSKPKNIVKPKHPEVVEQ